MEEIKDTNVTEQELGEVLRVRREKLANLRADGNDPFVKTKYEYTNYTDEIKADFDSFNEKTVKIAGRIMSRRIMGKASFFNIQDSKGNIQAYIRRDDVGEDNYAAFKKWDIGDIVGVEGFIFLTKTGEISIHTQSI